MNSIEYANLETVDKRAVVINFFFDKFNELNEFTFIKPKDLKNEYKLTSNQHRTLNRNFEWLLLKYLIIGETERVDSKKIYNTSFKLNDKEFKFNIPTDETKRFHYAKLLSSLLSSSESIASNISFFKETAEMGMSFISQLTDGIIREVLLASKIYEYYKCNSGNLLNIIAELSHYNQLISIEFTNRKIDKSIIESIGIYEDGEIELNVNNEIIVLKSIDEILNIFILSSKYPSSNVGMPNMNTKLLIDSLKGQRNYKKMVEIYDANCKDENIVNDNLEKFIHRISKPTKNCFTLSQRANRRIRIISEK